MFGREIDKEGEEREGEEINKLFTIQTYTQESKF